MKSTFTNRQRAWCYALGMSLLLATGCHRRIAVEEYPPNALKVRYVAATTYTDCLLASTVMCANYIAGQDRFAAPRVTRQMADEGYDMTRVGDVRSFFAKRQVKLIPLKGNLSDKPPLGLLWWVASRGYPVICVVNQQEADSPAYDGPDPVPEPEEFNHAVVVIGVDRDDNTDEVSGVVVLDPASEKRLERWDLESFSTFWDATDRVMLLMIDPTVAGSVAGVLQRPMYPQRKSLETTDPTGGLDRTIGLDQAMLMAVARGDGR
ncbi:MAG: hypothetical protein GXP29_06070 [Planctomycetes bacterium]|nr:hypothetical protein [Planctomycetota bacterium]